MNLWEDFSFRMRASLALFPLLAVSCAIRLAGQSITQNAAVKYLRADAALRQSYQLPPDAALKLEKALESSLDDEDAKLVAVAGDALTELQHGASLRICDWAMMVHSPTRRTGVRLGKSPL